MILYNGNSRKMQFRAWSTILQYHWKSFSVIPESHCFPAWHWSFVSLYPLQQRWWVELVIQLFHSRYGFLLTPHCKNTPVQVKVLNVYKCFLQLYVWSNVTLLWVRHSCENRMFLLDLVEFFLALNYFCLRLQLMGFSYLGLICWLFSS